MKKVVSSEFNVIFVSSADTYADLWPHFFELFKINWPAFEGVIYLNTESLVFHYEGLDIRCTCVGSLGSFGKVFRAGLEKVNGNKLLLVMIDYFFMGQVDVSRLNVYSRSFDELGLDSLCLVPNPYRKTSPLEQYDLELVLPPSPDMFSYQIAFWKKDVLREMALPHESPWLSEWYGTARANQMQLKLAFSKDGKTIPYLAEGALHKGKWVEPMVSYMKLIDHEVDYARRGYYVEEKPTLWNRFNQRLHTFWPRCLSVFDLFKRTFV